MSVLYIICGAIKARKQDKDGFLEPFVPFEAFEEKEITCDRDSQGEAAFADMGVSIVRPRCFADMKSNLPLKNGWEKNSPNS